MDPIRLLFVEDVLEEVDLVLREFARQGISTEWTRVDTADELDSQLRVFQPDVVLSDFTMPLYDGWSALARVQKNDPPIPFIFVSGTIGERRAAEALRGGAMDYVSKDNIKRVVPVVAKARVDADLRREKQRAVEQLRGIVDSSQDWLWELDADLRIVFASPSVQETLGLAPADVLGANFTEFLTRSQRDTVEAQLRMLDARQRTIRFMVSTATHYGSGRWLETNAIALIDAADQVTGFRGSSRDVTRREEQQHRILSLTRVMQMATGVNGALLRLRDRDQLLHETCRIAVNIGGYAAAHVSLLEPGRVLRVVVGCGASAPPGTILDLPPDPGSPAALAARAVATGETASSHVEQEHALDFPAAAGGHHVRAAASLPLRVDLTVVGALTLGAGVPGLLDGRELKLLTELAANLSFALQYLERESAVHFLSYFDPLTHLAKRPLFGERLEQRLARRRGGEPRDAVVVIDLERLGGINDSAGRHVGDGLLQRVADRLRGHLDSPECLAYLGAGVFALVAPMAEPGDQEAALVQERVAGWLAAPFDIEGHAIRASARYGLARFPDDGADAQSLLQNAEAALQIAKSSGEVFMAYRIQMQHGQEQRLKLEQRLRVALEEWQFLLHYQPKLDIRSGTIVGLEALLRWDEPGRGLVPPVEFLPVLEATHMIVEIGDRVIQRALDDLQVWRGQGFDLRVAVNVSTWQLRRRDFVERVLSRLGAADGGESLRLDIEITESALLHDSEDAVRKLSRLRDAGVGVAIDDFGTGYSSLSRLAQLPVDTLKIDRTFVAGLPADDDSRVLVTTIIALARAFSLTTVAEGVETRQQLSTLRHLGCDQSQGYLHGRPRPAGAITQLMRRRSRAPVSRKKH